MHNIHIKLLTIIAAILFSLCLFMLPSSVYAQGTLIQDKVSVVKAQVEEVISEKQEEVPGTNVTGINQMLKVKILEGVEKGKEINLSNDYVKLKEGEVFYLQATIHGEDGSEVYAVSEQYRLPSLLLLAILFVVLVIIFGGIQGVRGLLSLSGSLLLILYVLLPGILHGYSPILVTIGVASLIIIIGSYITHGFNKTTTSAVVGMIVTVIGTGALAYFWVKFSKLTGYASEEAVYLNLNTQGSIDMVGLLFGGIMIGLLGVLYDIAIGQAISVEELFHVAPNIGKATIYKRAIRIGREHIGALVNTLAIAYVGASLPLLLLFYTVNSNDVISPAVTINKEVFATEIVRTLIGSIGLVLAVPITTFISVWLLVKAKKSASKEILEEEREALEAHEHHH